MKAVRIVLLVSVVLALAACSGGGGQAATTQDDAAAPADEAGAEGSLAEEFSRAEPDAPNPAPAALQGGGAASAGAGGGASSGGGETGDDSAVEPPELEPLPDSSLSGQRIIKEGTVAIEVPDGKFNDAFDQVVVAARRLGGDVIGSSVQTADDSDDTSGSVTVRVPVEQFEDLLVALRGVGETRNQDITSQDVSAEFTDLESRLRHLEALERFYMGLFDKADDVQDAIAVQQKLQAVQGQIEKAQGRLNLLDDRTSFSTLTVEIFEPGIAATLPEEDPSNRPTLAQYWDTARDAFVNVVGAMLVALLFVVPLLVPMALLAVAALLWRRSRRSAAANVEPVRPEPEPEPERVGADA